MKILGIEFGRAGSAGAWDYHGSLGDGVVRSTRALHGSVRRR